MAEPEPLPVPEGEIFPDEYHEGDTITLNGQPIGVVTKVETRGDTTFVTASLSDEVAEQIQKYDVTP